MIGCAQVFIVYLVVCFVNCQTLNKMNGFNPKVSRFLQRSIKAENIENHLKELSSYPHIAGSHRDEVVLAKYVSDHFKAQGLEVEEHPYNVLLSYPVKDDLSYVAILHEGKEVFKSQLTEEVFQYKDDPTKRIVSPYNAYSASGDVSGDLVYLNYGRITDFNMMKDLGVDLKGKICMVKYGSGYRGDKALYAEKFGCIGLIIYSDPKDYVIGDKVYPEADYLPGGAVQRGSLTRGYGDVETPEYPSISTVHRKAENLKMPNIPVHPIGYDDALKYLSKLGGNEVPEAWKGGLSITYRLGPGFAGEYQNSKIFLHVKVTRERKITKNVVGYIRGQVEPDRYVVIGNHRDAWGFGAIDPSSGTAVMLEMARVFGEAVKKGWEPRRTIIFCSWGAEEFNLIGSTEWVEEFQKVLGARAVAHLNVDFAVDGDTTFGALTTPDLVHTLSVATKFTPDPDNSSMTVNDRWWKKSPAMFLSPSFPYPFHSTPSAESDHASFIQYCGIPSAFLIYTYDRFGTEFSLKEFPSYHTGYETFELMKEFIDSDFRKHVAIARVWSEATRLLADSPILPLKPVDYAIKVSIEIHLFLSRFGVILANNGINLDHIKNASQEFLQVATSFEARRQAVNKNDELLLRAYNDQAMQLNRAFLDHNRISKENEDRHLLFSASIYNQHAGSAMPGLYDSLFNIEKENTEERWNEVKRQYSVFLYHLGSATSTLRDFAPLKGFSNLHPFV